MSPGASGRFWDVSAPGQQPGQVDRHAVFAAAGDKHRLGHLGACQRSAALGQQVQQVHPLMVLVLPRRLRARAQDAHLAGLALAQCDGHFGLVELVGQAARQVAVQAVHGQACRVDLADDGVVEGAVGQDRDAGLEVVVAPHGDVELVVRRQDVGQRGGAGRRGQGRGGDKGRIRPPRPSGGEQGESREEGDGPRIETRGSEVPTVQGTWRQGYKTRRKDADSRAGFPRPYGTGTIALASPGRRAFLSLGFQPVARFLEDRGCHLSSSSPGPDGSRGRRASGLPSMAGLVYW